LPGETLGELKFDTMDSKKLYLIKLMKDKNGNFLCLHQRDVLGEQYQVTINDSDPKIFNKYGDAEDFYYSLIMFDIKRFLNKK